MKRSRGAVLLTETGRTTEEIGARVGVSDTLVSFWLTGKRKPTPARKKQLEAEFGIPVKAWDQAPAKSKVVALVAANGHVPTTREFAELLLRDSWAEIQASGGLAPRERQAVREKAAAVVERVGKITGEHSNISERKIMRTPAWQRVRSVIDRVLEGHPEIERQLGEELAKLGRESS